MTYQDKISHASSPPCVCDMTTHSGSVCGIDMHYTWNIYTHNLSNKQNADRIEWRGGVYRNDLPISVTYLFTYTCDMTHT